MLKPYTVGITIGHPSMITPRWATSPARSTAYSHARSDRPSARSLRCRVRCAARMYVLAPMVSLAACLGSVPGCAPAGDLWPGRQRLAVDCG